MPDLPIIERERLLRVALQPTHAPSEAARFRAEQPHIESAFMELAEDMAGEGINPALAYGIMLSAITTFYVALTEQIKANKSGTVQ